MDKRPDRRVGTLSADSRLTALGRGAPAVDELLLLAFLFAFDSADAVVAGAAAEPGPLCRFKEASKVLLASMLARRCYTYTKEVKSEKVNQKCEEGQVKGAPPVRENSCLARDVITRSLQEINRRQFPLALKSNSEGHT